MLQWCVVPSAHPSVLFYHVRVSFSEQRLQELNPTPRVLRASSFPSPCPKVLPLPFPPALGVYLPTPREESVQRASFIHLGTSDVKKTPNIEELYRIGQGRSVRLRFSHTPSLLTIFQKE